MRSESGGVLSLLLAPFNGKTRLVVSGATLAALIAGGWKTGAWVSEVNRRTARAEPLLDSYVEERAVTAEWRRNLDAKIDAITHQLEEQDKVLRRLDRRRTP